MASSISRVAICTARKFGPFLLAALKSEGFDTTVIVRRSSKATFPADQEIITVSDEFTENELTSAFRGIDAVVLSLPFEMLPHAGRFARASLAAGTRWLIASTYGANLYDPDYAQFPASKPHRQSVDELQRLAVGQDHWGWTSISCGPWPELSVAARAWNIDPVAKTAELVNGGTHIFSSSTREHVALTVARMLKKQPASMRNRCVYMASFEENMVTWLNAYKQVLGSDGWTVTEIDVKSLMERSQNHFASGDFHLGYTGTALAVCTGPGYQNRFSEFATLMNIELELPEEDLVDVVRKGLKLPNPFA